jgi:hypothetical protein
VSSDDLDPAIARRPLRQDELEARARGLEGVLRQHMEGPDGQRVDSLLYALLPGKLSDDGAADAA